MPWYQRMAVGAGGALVGAGHGIEQLAARAGNSLGMVPDSTVQNVQQTINNDAPFQSASTRGAAGTFGAALPYMVAGFATGGAADGAALTPYLAAMGFGAAQGVMQPVTGNPDKNLSSLISGNETPFWEQKLGQAGLGAAMGVGGQYIGNIGGRLLGAAMGTNGNEWCDDGEKLFGFAHVRTPSMVRKTRTRTAREGGQLVPGRWLRMNAKEIAFRNISDFSRELIGGISAADEAALRAQPRDGSTIKRALIDREERMHQLVERCGQQFSWADEQVHIFREGRRGIVWKRHCIQVLKGLHDQANNRLNLLVSGVAGSTEALNVAIERLAASHQKLQAQLGSVLDAKIEESKSKTRAVQLSWGGKLLWALVGLVLGVVGTVLTNRVKGGH